MKYTEVLNQVSEELNLPKDFIKKVYSAYWYAIKQHIQSLPLKDNIKQDEYNELKVNVNIPSIGKLYTTYDRIQNIKNRYNKYYNIPK